MKLIVTESDNGDSLSLPGEWELPTPTRDGYHAKKGEFKMTTVILSNGSKWAGQAPDTVDDLLDVLQKYALDRTFEKYGNFITRKPKYKQEFYAELGTDPDKTYNFFGNFRSLSHVFNIVTDDPEIVKKLRAAIRKNQKRADYLRQSTDYSF